MTPVTPITILLALAAVAGAGLLRPGRAVGLIVASMLLWPEFLRVPIGLAQMSVPRMAAIALIVRMGVTGRVGTVRWNWVDGVVVLGWLWDVAANLAQHADQVQMVYITGRALDTVVLYLAARLSLRSEADLRDLFAPFAATAIAMGLLGAMEAVTTWSPFQPLRAYEAWSWFEKEPEYRLGLLRAQGSTGHAIYFGIAMTILTGMVFALREMAGRRSVVFIAVAVGAVGAMASLSSGPQLALVVLVLTSLFLYARPLIKPALVGLTLLCILVEFASNRHFYQLIDYLALNEETAWYRARLLEVAVSHLPEYWLFGVGANWPHHWGAEIDTRQHVDVVNHYVIVALYGGLPSLLCYGATLVGALRASIVAAGSESSDLRRLGFGLGCVLIAVAVSSMSVGLFGPPLLLTYLLLGWMVALAEVADARAATVHRPASAALPAAPRATAGLT
jgi:hypothetical protein